MRGDCGFFVAGGTDKNAPPPKVVGGFYAWEILQNPVRVGVDGNCPVYRVSRYRLILKNWWLNEPGLERVTAVFCRVVKGRLSPVLEEVIRPGEYAAGKRNKELFGDKEMK